MGDLSRNFSRHEFACPDCGIATVDPLFITLLQRMRDVYGGPIVLSSGARCVAYHKRLYGIPADAPHAPTSAHVVQAPQPGDWFNDGFCHAADIPCTESRDRFRLVTAALHAGFRRIEIADRHIHIDNHPSFAQDVLWLGTSK